jgi:hypothetical protein
MRNSITRLGAVALAVAAMAAGGAVGRAETHIGAMSNALPTGGPSCSAVRGTAYVTYSKDEGKTLAPVADEMSGNVNTTGLVALTKDLLYVENQGEILQSRNGGCTWLPIGAVNYSPLTLTAGGTSRVYAWGDNANYFARIEGGTITELRVPIENIHGVGVDPANSLHVRVGGDNGVISESFNGGESWQRVSGGMPTDEFTLVYRMTFDPRNIDHVVAGQSVGGAWMSTDGGRTWTQSRFGLTGPTNIFNLVISPADPNVVWAMGIYLPLSDEWWGGRFIARSTDGGQNFTAVLRRNRQITLVNGPTMAAHPTDPNVLYFVFGTYFQNYGTDLYRYDARSGQVDIRHNGYDDINAIAFAPQSPDVIYFGLESHD